jgi:hypothetical protein
MDPKVLLLLPGLAGCHADQPSQTWRSLTGPATTINWPEDLNLPERRDSEHPAHEDPSPIYRGLVYSNLNVSNTAARTISLDSSASASGQHIRASMWPENNLIMVSSVNDLEVAGRVPPSLPFASNLKVSPDTTRHLSNPSTIHVQRAFTRRRS